MGKKLKYSTSEKIKPKYWNPEKQRAKETKSFSGYASLNKTLNDLAQDVKEAHRDLISLNRTPTSFKLKDALDKSLFKEEYAQKTTLLKFAKDIIEKSNRKKNTLNQWKQTFEKIRRI